MNYLFFTGSYRLSQLVPVCVPLSLLIGKAERRNNNSALNEIIILKNFLRIFNSTLIFSLQSLRSAFFFLSYFGKEMGK